MINVNNTNNTSDKNNKSILDIIGRNGTLTELKDYLQKHHITFEDVHSIKSDVLIYAIEKDVSFSVIQFLVEEYYYDRLNFVLEEEDARNTNNYYLYCKRQKIPIFLAILKQNFRVADLLIKHKADINFAIHDFNSQPITILNYLFQLSSLTTVRLNYILSHGFQRQGITNSFIVELIGSNYYGKTDVLESIFKYYVFDTTIILELLSCYRYKRPISKEQLNTWIKREKTKIEITDEMYDCAIYEKNYDLVNLWLDCDGSDEDTIIHRIYKYEIIENAVETCQLNSHYELIQRLLSLPGLDLEEINMNSIIVEIGKKKNVKLMKLVVDKLKRHNPGYDLSQIDFEEILIQVINEEEELDVVRLLIEAFQQLGTLNTQYINFEYILSEICRRDFIGILQFIMETLSKNPLIDIKNLPMENVLLEAIKESHVETVKTLIELYTNGIYNFNDIETLIIEGCRRNDLSIMKLILENLFLQKINKKNNNKQNNNNNAIDNKDMKIQIFQLSPSTSNSKSIESEENKSIFDDDINCNNNNNNKYPLKKNKKDEINFENVLLEAIKEYNGEIVEYLLTILIDQDIIKPNDINFTKIVEEASQHSHLQVFETLLSGISRRGILPWGESNDIHNLLKKAHHDPFKKKDHLKMLLETMVNINLEEGKELNVNLVNSWQKADIILLFNVAIEMANSHLVRFMMEDETLNSRLELTALDSHHRTPIKMGYEAVHYYSCEYHSMNYQPMDQYWQSIELFQYLIDHVPAMESPIDGTELLVRSLKDQHFLIAKSILQSNGITMKEEEEKWDDHPSFLLVKGIFKTVKSILKGNEYTDDYENDNSIGNDEDNDKENYNGHVNNHDYNSSSNKKDHETKTNRWTTTTLISTYIKKDFDQFKMLYNRSSNDELIKVDRQCYQLLHYVLLKEDDEFLGELLTDLKERNIYLRNFNDFYLAVTIAIQMENKKLFDLLINHAAYLVNDDTKKDKISRSNHLKINNNKTSSTSSPQTSYHEDSLLTMILKCHKLKEDDQLSMMSSLFLQEKDPNFQWLELTNNDFSSPISYAIQRKGESAFSIVEFLIQQGVSINSIDGEGKTPLIHAIQKNSLALVKLLLEHGAEVNFQSNPYTINENGNGRRRRRHYHNNSINDNNNNNDNDSDNSIDDENIDNDNSDHSHSHLNEIRTPLTIHPYNDLDEEEEDIHSNSNSCSSHPVISPLIYAIDLDGNNTVPIVELLLDYGAEINFSLGNGDSPIIHAIHRRSLPLVETLLARGAEVNPKEGPWEYSTLIHAVEENDLEMATCLIEHGANAQYGRQAILRSAIQQRSLPMVRLLMERGGVKVTEIAILMYAIRQGHLPVYIYLTEHSEVAINFKDRYDCQSLVKSLEQCEHDDDFNDNNNDSDDSDDNNDKNNNNNNNCRDNHHDNNNNNVSCSDHQKQKQKPSIEIFEWMLGHYPISCWQGKPLKTILSRHRLDLLTLLLKHYPSLINGVDDEGHSPLAYAIQYSDLEIVNFLLEKGVQRHRSDSLESSYNDDGEGLFMIPVDELALSAQYAYDYRGEKIYERLLEYFSS